MSIEPLLDIRNLTVTFNSQEGLVTAVHDLDLSLGSCETLGIVGESGSGKSVTALAMMGLIPSPPGKISSGEIFYNGKDLLKIKDRARREIRGNEISMIFQEPMTSLNPILTCGYQIAETLILHRGMKKKEAMTEAVNLLESVGLPDPEKSIKRFPHELSGGMRQRVMIAIALACEPKILIADEPTTALDVTTQAQILDLMKNLSVEHNTSILMITHDLGVVSEICERVMVMYTGHCVETAAVENIFSNPLHPYTVGLIASIPEITKEKVRLQEIPGVVPNPTDERAGCTFHPRCRKATEKCRIEPPVLVEAEKDHFVRCWLFKDLRDRG